MFLQTLRLALCLSFVMSFGAFAQTNISGTADNLSNLEQQLLLPETESSSESISPASGVSSGSNSGVKSLSENVDQDQLKRLEEAVSGPREIPLEHVLVVQRRYIQKENKHEITPFMLGVQPADSFRRQLQWGFSYAYHWSERFGLEALHVAFANNYSTGLDRDIEKATNLKTDFGNSPVVMMASSLVWTPFRSKAATRSHVYHFETYFGLGAGVALAESGQEGIGVGTLGFRAYLSRSALLKVEVRDYYQFSGNRQRVSFVVGGGILL